MQEHHKKARLGFQQDGIRPPAEALETLETRSRIALGFRAKEPRHAEVWGTEPGSPNRRGAGGVTVALNQARRGGVSL